MDAAVKSQQPPTNSPSLESERLPGCATILPSQPQRDSLATAIVAQLLEDAQLRKTGEFSHCLHANRSLLLTSPNLNMLFGMSGLDIR